MTVQASPETVPALPAEVQAEIDAGIAPILAQHKDEKIAKLDAEVAPPADPLDEAAQQVAEALKTPAAKEKATEKPAEEAERVGKLAQQLRKQQVKLVSEQQALSRQRTEIASREQKVQASLQEHQQVVALARSNPLEWLQKFAGIGAEDLAARLLNKNVARPEEMARQYDEKYSALEKKIQALETEKQQAVQATARDQALKAFVEAAKGNAERWPLASKWSDGRLKAEGMRIATEAKAAGTPLDDLDILDKIEESLSEIAALRGTSSSAATPVPKSPGSPVKKSPPKEPTPTLTQGATDGATDDGFPDADAVVAMLRDKEGYQRNMSALARRMAKANGLKRTGVDT